MISCLEDGKYRVWTIWTSRGVLDAEEVKGKSLYGQRNYHPCNGARTMGCCRMHKLATHAALICSGYHTKESMVISTLIFLKGNELTYFLGGNVQGARHPNQFA